MEIDRSAIRVTAALRSDSPGVIRPGEHDERGNPKPNKKPHDLMTRPDCFLDLYGKVMPPSYSVLCGGPPPYGGKRVPIIEVLCADGIIVNEEGAQIRASTNCPIDHPHDRFVWAICGRRSASGAVQVREKGKLRLGLRFQFKGGEDASIADLIEEQGLFVNDVGLVQREPKGQHFPFFWHYPGWLPRPETYVLQRSGLWVLKPGDPLPPNRLRCP
ncbi:MAG: hypothetical protein Kilf2KO_04730 [Rhodospirillales bacterium]